MSTENITQAQIMEAVKSLKDELETKSVDKAKVERITTFLDQYEAKSAEAAKKIAAAEDAAKEFEKKFEALEKEISKPQNANIQSKSAVKEIERKGLLGFMRSEYDAKSIPTEFKNIMRTDIESAGGVFVPEFMEKGIIKNITEISNIYALAKTTTVSTKRVKKVVRTGLPSVFRTGETQPTTESRSKYGSEAIDVHKYTCLVQVTQEELDDADINIEGEIFSDVSEAYAKEEGYDFVKGNGSNRPEGFMYASGVAEINNGHATEIKTAALIKLTGELKTGYNAQYVMNRKTLALIRTIASTTGELLWQAGNLQGGLPNQLNGESYTVLPDMDDTAANAYPIAYGDFKQAYEIVLRKGITTIKDIYTLKSYGLVEFMFTKRVGGKLTKKEALVKLKMAV